MNHGIKLQAPLPHILPVEGATNFRELGGYPAADGRRVKEGVFYRGGALCDLKSDADMAMLESLGIKLVLDLRSPGESSENPDPIPNGAKYLRIGAMYDPDGSEPDFSPAGMERIRREFASGQQGRSPLDAFASFYARMPFSNPAFQAMFRAMGAGDVPILFHCTSGKDRTGVAAMLILLALGADRETAVADYMATNRCRTVEIESLRRQHRGLEGENPEQWQQLMIRHGVLSRYADAALDAILERYGGWEDYFYEEYGLDHQRLSALRDVYLR